MVKASFFAKLGKNKFVQNGLPLVLLIVGGSLGIREFASYRIEARERNNHVLSAQEIDAHTSKPRRKFDLDGEFARLNDKMDIEKWENKRLPRPGEGTKGSSSSSWGAA